MRQPEVTLLANKGFMKRRCPNKGGIDGAGAVRALFKIDKQWLPS